MKTCKICYEDAHVHDTIDCLGVQINTLCGENTAQREKIKQLESRLEKAEELLRYLKDNPACMGFIVKQYFEEKNDEKI